jgi:hypothetical protein
VYGIRQAWIDYQNGRTIRKRESQAEFSGLECDRHNNSQRRVDMQAQFDQGQGGTDKALELREARKDRNLPRGGGNNYPRCLDKGWKYQGGEFPWQIERIVQEEENWRGVWVLEVKDMWSMEWEKEYKQKGRQWRLNTVSQGHWPFPYKREHDELRDWLERP